MIAKRDERTLAIRLRKSGLSYGQIREKVPVAKSTLALWFRDVHLARPQQQKLTERKRLAQLRGAQARQRHRIEQTALVMEQSRNEIKTLSFKDKLLIGVVLYWAEGTKQKAGNWAGRVQFGNSDPRMARLFQQWLLKVVKLKPAQIFYEIYVHENNKHRLEDIKRYWAGYLSVSPKEFDRVYFKRHNLKTNRKNRGNGYYGLIRISARASSVLNRKIAGWIEGIVKNWGIV